MADPRIIIRPEAFGHGYDIFVHPKPDRPSCNVELPTIEAARRYAAGLGAEHGWHIIDKSGEPA